MIVNSEYSKWLSVLKNNIRQCQIKAALKVNRELLSLYWQLGKEIVEKQETAQWGEGFIAQLSKDLSAEFPEMKGWSERNLRRVRLWYITYSQHLAIRTQLVSKIDVDMPRKNPIKDNTLQIQKQVVPEFQPFEDVFFSVPWGHHVVIMQKCKDLSAAIFYISLDNTITEERIKYIIEDLKRTRLSTDSTGL